MEVHQLDIERLFLVLEVAEDYYLGIFSWTSGASGDTGRLLGGSLGVSLELWELAANGEVVTTESWAKGMMLMRIKH